MLDLGTPIVRTLVRALEKISFRPERALQNLANTQKDDTATLYEYFSEVVLGKLQLIISNPYSTARSEILRLSTRLQFLRLYRGQT